MACVDTDALPDDALPSVEALMAGTVALMTAFADPCPQGSLAPEDLRRLLARKIVSNLFFLQSHPGVSPALRQSLALARARWVGLTDQAPPPDTRDGGTGARALH